MPAIDTTNLEEFCSRDPLRWIVFLKMITYHGSAARGYADGDALMLSFPTALSNYDSASYPHAEVIVVYDGGSAPGTLLDELDPGLSYIFKVHNHADIHPVRTKFGGTVARAFVSFSRDCPIDTVDTSGVNTVPHPGSDFYTLFVSNGYSVDELDRYFSNGAYAYGIFQNRVPVAACFCFPNHLNIWEVAGVHTLTAFRRRGYARSLVSCVVNDLLADHRIPRYQVEDGNTASIELARSAGFREICSVSHIYRGEK